MDYCDHCEGQRFDRARVLRALRRLRERLRTGDDGKCARALDQALRAVRELDLPHLELEEEGDEIVH